MSETWNGYSIQGAFAFRNKHGSNPYPSGSPARKQWQIGYDRAASASPLNPMEAGRVE